VKRTWALILVVFGIPARLLGYLHGLAGRIGRYLGALPGRIEATLAALPSRVAANLRSLPGRIWRSLLATKRALVGTNPTPVEVLFSVGLLVSIVGVVGTFLYDQTLTPYPLLALLALAVVGWSLLPALGFTKYQARTAKLLTLFATVATVLTVGFITYFLFERAWGPISTYGDQLLAIPRNRQTAEPRWFFFMDWLGVLPVSEVRLGSGWDPSNGHYSLMAAAWATVLVTLVAGAVAGPLGLLGALFIAEIANERVRSIVKPGIEILAGVPSIVYGFIGFSVLNTFIQDQFLDPGASFLIAGLVVGVMALPTVVSVSEDSLSAVPNSMRDGSVAMGATNWQTMKSISIPAAFSGISAAIILGLGRALGETMAVAAIMAGGNTFAKPLYDIFDQSATLTSRIAVTYGSASEATVNVLFVAGVMLFSIVAVMSVIAQYVERRMKRKLQGDL
jgi:phosphate transport system permease protein